ncbi:YihY/virulence factor BrkB family protein [Caminibacter sp.]
MKINKELLKKLQDLSNEITLYAAALSFYTIFAMVPLLLLIFSIFMNTPLFNEFYVKIENFLISNLMPSNEEIIKTYLHQFLQNGSKMGFVGGIYILISSILFFNNLEEIVAKIFGQKKRNLWEKIQTYWTLTTLIPILFSAAIFISLKIQLFLDVSFIMKILPFFLIWLSFYVFYKIILINETTKSVVIVSFLIAIAFAISKIVFIYYIKLSTTAKSLYGSFSLILFMFFWIYINWILVISGIYLIKYFDKKFKGENNGYQ